MSGAGWPARYEIRLDGVLDARWSDWFGELKVESEADETILSGTLSDQSALHGLLDKARDQTAPEETLGRDERSSSWAENPAHLLSRAADVRP